ncbi:MAG: nucleotidyltransferase domain-containing protein [Methanocellales archaeon]|nr:nucleotidyltransferase domain-containing protein [Methanocellales archaeon]
MKELTSQLKKICDKKGIVYDIVIFGSAVKEKPIPKDIDIIVIFWHEDYPAIESAIYDIRNIGKELNKNLHVEYIALENLFKEPVFLSLIHEGYSIREDRPIRDMLNTESCMLVTYNLKNLDQSEKTLFNFAMKGRGDKRGIFQEVGAKAVGRGSVLVPIDKFERFREFLDYWEIDYMAKRVMILKAV